MEDRGKRVSDYMDNGQYHLFLNNCHELADKHVPDVRSTGTSLLPGQFFGGDEVALWRAKPELYLLPVP